jgi:uncharacterized protein
MEPIHFSHYKSILEAIVGFSELCRKSGLPVGLSHTKEAIKTAEAGLISNQQTYYYALKSLFCTCPEEETIFDQCFKIFWQKRKHKYAHNIQKKGMSNVTKNTKSSLVMVGFNSDSQEEPEELDEAKSVSGASKIETLKYTDFSKILETDSAYLEELTRKLLRQLNQRLKRRLTTSKKGKIDIRKSIRNNLSAGEEIINLKRQRRKIQKMRLVVLLDVSGSMDKYSFFLLKFIWSLKSHLKNIEAFIFSTDLVRITDYLGHDQLNESLMQMSQKATNWSGGTKIGACLKDFNDQFSKSVMNGRNITIILSDGLDDGDPADMSKEVQRIKLRTKKLVWLNPLKGMDGYQPLAKGMAAALPALDEFHSAHNLNSLMELENILSHA